jgi:succinoglycan biosynthesis protein ExoA
MKSTTKGTTVSVILAVRNEVRFIEQVLYSLLNQETLGGLELEILVIDGNSEDGTQELVQQLARSDRRIRLLQNEKRSTPFAFNIGLCNATGEYVCIMGAHTIYERNYIATCLHELWANAAVACGGRVITRPADRSVQAMLVAWAMGHPFGSSRKSFRTLPEGFARTVNYPVVLRQALMDVGGYDERLIRNQDNVMNRKLVDGGHKLFCTWKTSCEYHARRSVLDLVKYAFQAGYWNVISFRVKNTSMRFFHFVPLFFVLVLLICALTGGVVAPFAPIAARDFLFVMGFLVSAHLLLGCIASLHVALGDNSRNVAMFLLPPVFFLFHSAYGLGILFAILKNATPEPDSTSRSQSSTLARI